MEKAVRSMMVMSPLYFCKTPLLLIDLFLQKAIKEKPLFPTLKIIVFKAKIC